MVAGSMPRRVSVSYLVFCQTHPHNWPTVLLASLNLIQYPADILASAFIRATELQLNFTSEI